MFWFQKKKAPEPEVPREVESDNAISYCLGSCYAWEGYPKAHEERIFSVWPSDLEVENPSFPAFSVDYGKELLACYPFVTETFGYYGEKDPRQFPFVEAYRKMGGTVIFAEEIWRIRGHLWWKKTCRQKSVLLAASEYDEPKLLAQFKKNDLGIYGYDGYGYLHRPVDMNRDTLI